MVMRRMKTWKVQKETITVIILTLTKEPRPSKYRSSV
jgi:hypothetical protein